MSRLGLVAVVLVAAAIRLPALDRVPAGFWCDEAVNGYDAWSIAQTGRDHHGAWMPLFARGLGDYNESLYRFLAVPSVALLGLDEVSTRLPAALAGIAGVLALYLLAHALFGVRTAVLAGLLLAMSPWHVQFSRLGFRAILLPGLFTLGLWLFHRGRLRLAGAVLGLSLYTYSAARVFVPLFAVGLVVIYHRTLWQQRRAALLGGAAFLVALGLLLPFWLSAAGMARADSLLAGGPGAFVRSYLGYFDPRFLFAHGDPNLRHGPSGVGVMHLFEAGTLPIGIVLAVRRRAWTPLLWLWLYPIPAALTAPTQALRALVGAPGLCLLSALGLAAVADRVPRRAWGFAGAVAAVLAAGGVYAHTYFGRYRVVSAPDFDAGLGEAVRVAERRADPCVVVSDRFFLPHVFILFYGRIPPETAWENPVAGVRQGHWRAERVLLGRYQVQPIRGLRMTGGRCLVMLRPHEAAALARTNAVRSVHDVRAPDGGPVVIRLLEAWPLSTPQQR